MKRYAAILVLMGLSFQSHAQCASKQLTFADGTKACMELFEPLVIGGEGRNIAEQAGNARTHAYAITALDSSCPASSGWSWNSVNDDARAVGFCEEAARRKTSRTACRCIALIPVSGNVPMTQKDFVGTIFTLSFDIIEQVRASSPARSASLDSLMKGLEGREKMHYDRIDEARARKK